jgi:hypothetical protein
MLVRCGADTQLAALDGNDFAYNGVFLYGETESALPLSGSLDLQLGWGYRDYYDFTSSPSRNENLWRVSIELRKEVNLHWMGTGFLTFDRFAADNTLFDAERFLAGVMMTYTW